MTSVKLVSLAFAALLSAHTVLGDDKPSWSECDLFASECT